MKVALVCDWLTNVGGAEKVLLTLHNMYPEAPIYTSKYDKRGINWFLDADVRTGWLQIFPTGLRRLLGPLRQIWFSHLDLSEYDLVISVTGAEAKAAGLKNKMGGNVNGIKQAKSRKNDGPVHVSYCHVPTQYYWQMYDDYAKNPGFGVLNPLVRVVFKALVRPLRKADYQAARQVDQFVTISGYASGLIRKYYKRTAKIVHPPVDIDNFSIKSLKSQESNNVKANKLDFSHPDLNFSARHTLASRQNRPAGEPVGCVRNIRVKNSNQFYDSKNQVYLPYYITTSRQVTWKRLDLAILACVKLKRKLVVIGEGPEHENLVKLAAGSEWVEFLPLMKKEELVEWLRGAQGYLFPSLEPFGIAPVEALASGCPVIAYGAGGALDYVEDGKNGVLFGAQTVDSLTRAIREFEKMKFDRKKVAASVKDYAEARFVREMKAAVKEAMKRATGDVDVGEVTGDEKAERATSDAK
ncbi:glycosyltransferase [Candidatus Saccharibacteria bacterium]|nr:glycosyltransferase [Candidatus Saccharibacteria bacterium]